MIRLFYTTIILCFTLVNNIYSQETKSAESNTAPSNFKPLIIGTDALSPLNIRLEKALGKKFALSLRFFNFIFRSPLNGNEAFNSFVIDTKFFIKQIEKKPINLYWGAYLKFRHSTKDFPIFENERDENFFYGATFGLKSFYNKFSVDYHIGAGMNSRLPKGQYYGGKLPFDLRANVTFGYTIFN
jgi:hypothetical protein